MVPGWAPGFRVRFCPSQSPPPPTRAPCGGQTQPSTQSLTWDLGGASLSGLQQGREGRTRLSLVKVPNSRSETRTPPCLALGREETSPVSGHWKVRKQALHTPPTVLPFNRHALCQHLEPRECGSPLLPQEPSGLCFRRRTVPAPAGARQQRSGLLHRVLAESPREGTAPRGLPTPATPCCGTWASCRASLSLGASPAPWG